MKQARPVLSVFAQSTMAIPRSLQHGIFTLRPIMNDGCTQTGPVTFLGDSILTHEAPVQTMDAPVLRTWIVTCCRIALDPSWDGLPDFIAPFVLSISQGENAEVAVFPQVDDLRDLENMVVPLPVDDLKGPEVQLVLTGGLGSVMSLTATLILQKGHHHVAKAPDGKLSVEVDIEETNDTVGVQRTMLRKITLQAFEIAEQSQSGDPLTTPNTFLRLMAGGTEHRGVRNRVLRVGTTASIDEAFFIPHHGEGLVRVQLCSDSDETVFAYADISVLGAPSSTVTVITKDLVAIGSLSYSVSSCTKVSVSRTMYTRWGPLEGLSVPAASPSPRAAPREVVPVEDLSTHIVARVVIYSLSLPNGQTPYPPFHHFTIQGVHAEKTIASFPAVFHMVAPPEEEGMPDHLKGLKVIFQENEMMRQCKGFLRLRTSLNAKTKARLFSEDLESAGPNAMCSLEILYSCESREVLRRLPIPAPVSLVMQEEIATYFPDPLASTALSSSKNEKDDLSPIVRELRDENENLRRLLVDSEQDMRRLRAELKEARATVPISAEAAFATLGTSEQRHTLQDAQTTAEKSHSRVVGRNPNVYDSSHEAQVKRFIAHAIGFVKNLYSTFETRVQLMYQRSRDVSKTMDILQDMVTSHTFATSAHMTPVEDLLRVDPSGRLVLSVKDGEGRNVLHVAALTMRLDFLTVLIHAIHKYIVSARDPEVDHVPPTGTSPRRGRHKREITGPPSASQTAVDWDMRVTSVGHNVLHCAVQSGHVKAVECLCRLAMHSGAFGRLFSGVNHAKQDPLTLAKGLKFSGIAAYLSTTANSIYRDMWLKLRSSEDELLTVLKNATQCDDTLHACASMHLSDVDTGYSILHAAVCAGYEKVVSMFMRNPKPARSGIPCWSTLISGSLKENVLHSAIKCNLSSTQILNSIVDSASRDGVLHHLLTQRNGNAQNAVALAKKFSKDISTFLQDVITRKLYDKATEALLSGAEIGAGSYKEIVARDPGLIGLEVLRDSQGNTVFHIAARSGRASLLTVLTGYVEQAQMLPVPFIEWAEMKNMEGDTTLHLAVMHGGPEVIKAAIEGCRKQPTYEAVLEMKGSKGYTALALAKTYKDGREVHLS